MWWGKSSDSKDAKAAPAAEAAATASAAATTVQQNPERYDTTAKNSKDASSRAPFDPRLPDREKLPPALQKIVEKQDREENFFDELVDG